MEYLYLNSDTVYAETEHPMHFRWEAILGWFPEMARRSFAEDLTDLYTRAYERGSYQEVMMGAELGRIQARYWHVMEINRLSAKHIAFQGKEYAYYWQAKLYDRSQNVTPSGRQDTRLRKARVPPLADAKVPTRHLWLN